MKSTSIRFFLLLSSKNLSSVGDMALNVLAVTLDFAQKIWCVELWTRYIMCSASFAQCVGKNSRQESNCIWYRYIRTFYTYCDVEFSIHVHVCVLYHLVNNCVRSSLTVVRKYMCMHYHTYTQEQLGLYTCMWSPAWTHGTNRQTWNTFCTCSSIKTSSKCSTVCYSGYANIRDKSRKASKINFRFSWF